MTVHFLGQAVKTNTRMTRAQAARCLTEAGFPISRSRLAKLAMYGSGPDIHHLGAIVRSIIGMVYFLGPVLAKCSPTRRRLGGSDEGNRAEEHRRE